MDKNLLASIARKNIRLFIAFRVLFNARFYYPVFAVIYLDFGMTLEQFAILNSIWAATIIIAEVPSGALSDLIGRKKLLVLAGVLMVAEMVIWAFAPTENLRFLFWILAANRVLSGLAEAAASGSDEALAYDSLEQAGRKDDWAHVLQSVSRWQSMGFIIALIIGGLVYDPKAMGTLLGWFGHPGGITAETTLRWPLYLNLITAVATFICVSAMAEPGGHLPKPEKRLSVGDAFAQTWKVGRWILVTPFALVVIIAAASLDSAIRMFITMNAEYYRIIHYPAVAFGFIGAATAFLNYFVADWARKMTERNSPEKNFGIIAAIVLTAFVGISFFIPYIGVIFTWMLFAGIMMTGFCTSYYLNQAAEQSIRATLLSFKGLALNLGYGLLGILYALLVLSLRKEPEFNQDPNGLFRGAAVWFSVWFGIAMLGVVSLRNRINRNKPKNSDGEKS